LRLQVDKDIIVVFGGRHPAEGDREYAEAVKLGSMLASAGFAIMSGGYTGAMAAVSRGAREAGGIAIGVTMEIFGDLPPNPYLTHEIRTRDFFERLQVLTSHASGFIALRGGMGTLTEISLIWNMLQTRTMPDKPMILAGKFWRPLLESIAGRLVISGAELDLFQYADTAEDAVSRLRSMISAAT
jgi:uncharacterized protein (TIGR00730 family)